MCSKMSLCSLFTAEGITDHDLDTFVDMYREHCEVGILLNGWCAVSQSIVWLQKKYIAKVVGKV